LAAGPFHEKGGIFIFDPSLGDLNEKLQGDPAIMNNRFLLEIFDFKAIIGGVCPVGEEYEMVSYQFARFHPFSGSQINEKAAISTEELNDLRSKLEIISYAEFASGAGAILIYNADEKSEIISNLRVLNDFEYSLVEKKLYIAKGSFCEN